MMVWEVDAVVEQNRAAAREAHADGRHANGTLEDRSYWALVGCTDCERKMSAMEQALLRVKRRNRAVEARRWAR